jgi:GNAT superfamily N-acetyltransferase
MQIHKTSVQQLASSRSTYSLRDRHASGHHLSMDITVQTSVDAVTALDRARSFLEARPVEHNILLTILAQDVQRPHRARYWWAQDHDEVCGFALSSPRDYYVALAPAPARVIDALATAIAGDAESDGVTPLGVIAEAGTASRFAAEWADRAHVGVEPTEVQRLHQLVTPIASPEVSGSLRHGTAADFPTLLEWARGFRADTGHVGTTDDETLLRRNLADDRLYVWEDGGPRTMASLSVSACNVARVQWVYTPPSARRRGAASAAVAAVSSRALELGASTCVLVTQMSNPTSNAIYRAVGYEPVLELLRYEFG